MFNIIVFNFGRLGLLKFTQKFNSLSSAPKIYEDSSSVYSEWFFHTCANHGCSHPDIGRSSNGFRGGIAGRFWARYFTDRP
jgi:hypothetical protein